MWPGWVVVVLAIVALWTLPIAVTHALFRTSLRGDREPRDRG